MHAKRLSDWVHDHVFHTSNEAAERSTRLVMWITAITMVVEIAAGWWFNSMALLADGWHMSSHAVAIGLSAFAYATARRYAQDPRFAFGTWKIEILGGFASAIFLMGVAVMMLVGSTERIVSPQPIQYKEAIVIAILGLMVNVVCALILGKAHHHDHGHSHDHHHGHAHDDHHHHDLNLKSAYLHVIADAAAHELHCGAERLSFPQIAHDVQVAGAGGLAEVEVVAAIGLLHQIELQLRVAHVAAHRSITAGIHHQAPQRTVGGDAQVHAAVGHLH